MKKKFQILFLLIFLIKIAIAQEQAIIPKPQEMSLTEANTAFSITKSTIIISDAKFHSDAIILATYLKKITGFPISIREKADKRTSVSMILLKYVTKESLPAEGYIMDVSSSEIQIQASHSAGTYYGCMSLLQSISHDKSPDRFRIAAMHIEDQPRFAWRGLMLDCSRTFISLDYLRKTIDRMSFYKLNVLHLHLTDDQGWRLQIKKYPLLTSKGAYFGSKYNEPKEFQGFYTQDQMKNLVAYASKRHVTIVPEIEFPGHSHAALYAYPDLSCTGNISPIYPFSAGPSITSTVFCPANKKVYLFFKNIIKEVAEIFPSSYIHLGGDEVPNNAWSNCKGCQAMMDSLGLRTQNSLQGYMMNKVGSNVLSVNKRPIGWDEIYQMGVRKETVIMVWRSQKTGIEATKDGYDVVLCPTSNLYFDYPYSITSTKKVYSYQPVPDDATAEDKRHYLGIQACFWSHIDRTESKIDYQLYPRLLALAERAWSDKNTNEYKNFAIRKSNHSFWFNFFDIKYNRNESD